MARPREGEEPTAPPALSTNLARRFQVATLVSALACGGYFLVARVVLNLFPFSSFSMYAGSRGGKDGKSGEGRGCHLLAVGPGGKALDVSEYTAWDCPPWQDAARRSAEQLACDVHANVEAHIREHIDETARPDPTAEPVRLVRRLWVFREGEPLTTRDLDVVTCRAVLR